MRNIHLLALLYIDAFWHYNRAKSISGSHQLQSIVKGNNTKRNTNNADEQGE